MNYDYELYQLRVSFNRLFNALRLDADVALRDRSGAVLQKPLDQGNVIAIRLVNLSCVPLAEAVGADHLKAKINADDGKLLLDCSLCDQAS